MTRNIVFTMTMAMGILIGFCARAKMPPQKPFKLQINKRDFVIAEVGKNGKVQGLLEAEEGMNLIRAIIQSQLILLNNKKPKDFFRKDMILFNIFESFAIGASHLGSAFVLTIGGAVKYVIIPGSKKAYDLLRRAELGKKCSNIKKSVVGYFTRKKNAKVLEK